MHDTTPPPATRESSPPTSGRARLHTPALFAGVLTVAALAFAAGSRVGSAGDPALPSDSGQFGSALPAIPAHSPTPISTPGRASESRGPTWAPVGDVASGHAPGAPLPPEAARRVTQLEERIRADESDTASRGELARLLLEHERWFEAFGRAEELAAVDPDDPDALYVRSVVRMRMGLNREASADLERLVADHPDHADGWRALGLGRLRAGDAESAVRTWERGLTAVGGRHDELERLLAVSRSARAEKEQAG